MFGFLIGSRVRDQGDGSYWVIIKYTEKENQLVTFLGKVNTAFLVPILLWKIINFLKSGHVLLATFYKENVHNKLVFFLYIYTHIQTHTQLINVIFILIF